MLTFIFTVLVGAELLLLRLILKKDDKMLDMGMGLSRSELRRVTSGVFRDEAKRASQRRKAEKKRTRCMRTYSIGWYPERRV